MDSLKKKDEIQLKSLNLWVNNQCKGSLALATGTGKTKVALLAIDYLINTLGIKKPNILLAVPTESLRDVNWLDEFVKWKVKKFYKFLDRNCYVSLKKIEGQHYDLVILDEIHNLTESNSEFFSQNTFDRIIGLSATPPSDEIKKLLISMHCPVIFEYKLETAIDDGVAAPYKINLVEIQLDNRDKYITSGTKLKPFMNTEYKQYAYLTKKISVMRYLRNANGAMFAQLNRLRFLGNLKSKTEVAKQILNKYMVNDRSLIFCHGIDQANELCEHRFHSKTKDTDLKKLRLKQINRLSCVKALNEGENISDLDSAIIIQVNSVERNLIQQLGRIVRFRKGHEATIWVLIAVDTQDEVWWKSCSENLDKQKITYINSKNL